MILTLTVIRILDSTVIPQHTAALGFLQDVLVDVGFALRRGLQLLHHILELLQHLIEFQL